MSNAFEKLNAGAAKMKFGSTESFLVAKSNREMKTCSYCGKEYPDDAVVCELDESPLVFSKPKPLIRSSNASKQNRSVKQPITFSRILSAIGFAILAGLSGFGATWLVVGILANFLFRSVDDKFAFAAKGMPILIAGGITGFFVGLAVSLKVARGDPKVEDYLEKKYIGQTGRIKIYMGAPVFVIAISVAPFFEKLLNTFGSATGSCVGLGIALAIIAASLYFYDKIPEKIIIPIGVIGWMLTLAMIFWFGVLRH